jgi:hypothetical protein
MQRVAGEREHPLSALIRFKVIWLGTCFSSRPNVQAKP